MSRKPKRVDDINVPDAILASDPGKRLDALIRRHGGTPPPNAQRSRRAILPAIGKWGQIDDQLTLDDELPEPLL